jgi:hypothetical protein
LPFEERDDFNICDSVVEHDGATRAFMAAYLVRLPELRRGTESGRILSLN